MPSYVRRRGFLAVTLLSVGLAAAPATSSSAATPKKAAATKSVKSVKNARKTAVRKRCFRRTVRGKRRLVCTYVRTFRARRGAKARRDRTAPRMTLTAPKTLSGTVPNEICQAAATDESGVRRVDFAVDGARIQREYDSAYTCAPGSSSGLDSTQFSNGDHVLKATAVDNAGNTSTTKVTVNVANSPMTTRPVAPATPQAETTPTPPPAPAGPTVLDETFDDSSFSLWQSVQRAFDDRISTVDAPGGRTGKVGRFEVRDTDRLSGTARAELAFTREQVGEGMIRTYKWKTMFAGDYPSAPQWQNIAQWKNEGEGTPPMQVQVIGEEIALQAGWQHNWKKFWKTPLVRGQWLEFEVKMKFSENGSDGWAEVRFNGEQVLPRTAMQNLYPGLENYFKVGLYRDTAIRGTGVVYHDDVQILES